MHTVKITIDCIKDDDAKWGTTTTHEVRELSYEKLVGFQRELFESLGAIILSYGEAKVAANTPGKEPSPTVTTTNYVR